MAWAFFLMTGPSGLEDGERCNVWRRPRAGAVADEMLGFDVEQREALMEHADVLDIFQTDFVLLGIPYRLTGHQAFDAKDVTKELRERGRRITGGSGEAGWLVNDLQVPIPKPVNTLCEAGTGLHRSRRRFGAGLWLRDGRPTSFGPLLASTCARTLPSS